MKRIILSTTVVLALAISTNISAQNVGFGPGSLSSITTGSDNSALGANSLFSTTTGSVNVGLGHSALYSNINGGSNIGVGYASLYSNTSGNDNVAVGTKALASNTTGEGNVGIGTGTLNANTLGSYNVGAGFFTLSNNIDGRYNVALGYFSLVSNSSGSYNHTMGYESLKSNSTGNNNTAIGLWSMFNSLTGDYNYSIGYAAMYENTTGSGNVAMGGKALAQNTTGSSNTAIGISAGPNAGTYSNSTALGANTTNTASNQVRVGSPAVTSIGGFAAWTNLSDGRFKSDIQENVIGLDFINRLRPVSYKVDVDKLDAFLGNTEKEFYQASNADPIYQTGFIAQEVEQVAKESGFDQFNGVDAPKNDKDHYGLRYSEFVVPLVKAVQELSSNQEALLARIDELERELQESNNGVLKSETNLNTKEAPGYDLKQNSPNPFSAETVIKMNLPEDAFNAQLIIYTMEGKELKVIPVNGTGEVSVTIHANELEAGMYLYALISNNEVVSTKQMILTNK